jgi:hypothetical protein
LSIPDAKKEGRGCEKKFEQVVNEFPGKSLT